MKPETDELWLDLEEEYTDFLWHMAQCFMDERNRVADGNKVPNSRIEDMTNSLFGRC